ncbi:MAG TPA: low molecular weight protein arginine phosphatase [Nitrospinota bacterium]|nr:low molecular weight protein arginine phosphatase [Nitrospinota bacterium]
MKIKKILFVCTANICRSPMAETILKEKLKNSGMTDISVFSAGLMDMKGGRAREEALKIIEGLGVDISRHRSRHFSDEMVKDADLIIVMESDHREKILSEYPEAKEKVFLLSSFGNQKGMENDIADPYGGSIFSYRVAFREINFYIEGLMRYLRGLS